MWHYPFLNKLPQNLASKSPHFFLTDLNHINAGVPRVQYWLLLCLLYINDLLASTTNSIHSYADDNTLHSTFRFLKPASPDDLVNTCKVLHLSLAQDHQKMLGWGTKNFGQFSASLMQSCSLSHKTSKNPNDIPKSSN